MDSIDIKVRQIISQVTGLDEETSGTANLYLDLGVASVHALQILADLEDHFGVSIPDEEFVDATSIDQLTSVIRSLVPAEESARA